MKTFTLPRGQVAIIDDEDYELVKKYKWRYYGRYVEASVNGKTAYLHRLILNTPEGMVTDHKSGNRLDNRRENLRACTTSENSRNRNRAVRSKSGYKGVFLSSNGKRWQAEIWVNRKRIYLGKFRSAQEAAHAYDLASWKYCKKYASYNLSKTIVEF